MEDILYYIGLGLIITISLARKTGKNSRKKGAKRIDSGHPAPMPGFPPINDIPEELKHLMQPEFSEPVATKPQPQTSEHYFEEAQSLETIFDEIQEANYTYVPAKSKATDANTDNNSSSASSTPQNTQKAAKTEKNIQIEEQNETTDNFDLREAVIYSEILRPKFEEE